MVRWRFNDIISNFDNFLRFVKIQWSFRTLKEDKTIDINARNKQGWTPFRLAWFNGRKDVVKVKIFSIQRFIPEDKIIDINARHADGVTPFRLNCYNGHIEVVQAQYFQTFSTFWTFDISIFLLALLMSYEAFANVMSSCKLHLQNHQESKDIRNLMTFACLSPHD